MFWCVPEFLKTKAELFHLIKKLWNKTKTFWCIPEFFKTDFLTGSHTTSTGTFLASSTLSRPLLTFSGTSSSLSQPLRHLKASIDTLTASTDTLTASKALSRPLQSTSTLLACNRRIYKNFLTTVRVLLRPWECCILSQPLWAPLQSLTMGTLTASTSTFMASTTLTRPLQTLSRLCNSLKASSGTLTGYTSTPTGSTALLWPLHAISRTQLWALANYSSKYIYIFTAHIVQKNVLKAMRGLLEAMRVLLEAVRVLLEAIRVLV